MLNLLLHLASLFQQEGGVNKEATWTRRRRQQGGGVMNTGSGAENYISKHWSPATCLSFGTCPSSDGVRGGGKNSPPPSHLKFSGFRNFWRTHNKLWLFKIQDVDRSASLLQSGIFFILIEVVLHLSYSNLLNNFEVRDARLLKGKGEFCHLPRTTLKASVSLSFNISTILRSYSKQELVHASNWKSPCLLLLFRRRRNRLTSECLFWRIVMIVNELKAWTRAYQLDMFHPFLMHSFVNASK